MKNKIIIGVSSCLLGEKVRWNGDHKQDRYVRDVLGSYFDYVAICPEVEAGMGVPRETVALYGNPENPQMISKQTQADWTKKMQHNIKGRINQLDNLCGYIFKSKSPSCGLNRIPVYTEVGSSKAKHGPGMFANAFIKAFPLVPTEDEGRLNNPRIRENFILRVFSFNRLQTALLQRKADPGTLVKFHTQHKLLLLAHSRKHYQDLGRIVAEVKQNSCSNAVETYASIFMKALTFKSTSKKNTHVLLHAMAFFRKLLSGKDKKDILGAIEDYRREWVPLVVPATRIRHYAKKYRVDYLQDQIYLNPHPKESLFGNPV